MHIFTCGVYRYLGKLKVPTCSAYTSIQQLQINYRRYILLISNNFTASLGSKIILFCNFATAVPIKLDFVLINRPNTHNNHLYISIGNFSVWQQISIPTWMAIRKQKSPPTMASDVFLAGEQRILAGCL